MNYTPEVEQRITTEKIMLGRWLFPFKMAYFQGQLCCWTSRDPADWRLFHLQVPKNRKGPDFRSFSMRKCTKISLPEWQPGIGDFIWKPSLFGSVLNLVRVSARKIGKYSGWSCETCTQHFLQNMVRSESSEHIKFRQNLPLHSKNHLNEQLDILCPRSLYNHSQSDQQLTALTTRVLSAVDGSEIRRSPDHMENMPFFS